MKALLVLSALLLSAPAMAGTWITTGTAKLPSEIKVTKDGQVVAYSTAGINSREFDLYRDNNFGMGARTKCDPYIGDTAEEVEVPVEIQSRYEQGDKWDSKTGGFNKLSEGRTGRATIVIPKGLRVFGRCQNNSNTLNAISIQGDQTFRIEY